MYKNDLDLTADIIDIRNIIERVEELGPEVDSNAEGDHISEWKMLTAILSDLQGMGGDEQWRGEWYPVTLIRDSYFQTYAQELAEDIGAIKADSTWPHTCIDWEHAARELQYDYSAVEINGATYWTR